MLAQPVPSSSGEDTDPDDQLPDAYPRAAGALQELTAASSSDEDDDLPDYFRAAAVPLPERVAALPLRECHEVAIRVLTYVQVESHPSHANLVGFWNQTRMMICLFTSFGLQLHCRSV